MKKLAVNKRFTINKRLDISSKDYFIHPLTGVKVRLIGKGLVSEKGVIINS